MIIPRFLGIPPQVAITLTATLMVAVVVEWPSTLVGPEHIPFMAAYIATGLAAMFTLVPVVPRVTPRVTPRVAPRVMLKIMPKVALRVALRVALALPKMTHTIVSSLHHYVSMTLLLAVATLFMCVAARKVWSAP